MRKFSWTLLLCAGLATAQTPSAPDHPLNTPEMAKHYGHGTPPIGPLTDLDHKPFTLKPLQDRWTLLYYWADWCIPCIGQGIPALTSFVQTHQADKAKFQIVAIRFGSTHENFEWADFHAKTLKLESTVWHGAPPFPMVYDESSVMTTAWGIHELPTYALIDPHGNLVRDGDLETLRARIDRKSN